VASSIIVIMLCRSLFFSFVSVKKVESDDYLQKAHNFTEKALEKSIEECTCCDLAGYFLKTIALP